MKFKTFAVTLVLGLTLTTASLANDINSSWSVRTLQGQAMSSMVKQAKMKKYAGFIPLQSQQNNSAAYRSKSRQRSNTITPSKRITQRMD